MSPQAHKPQDNVEWTLQNIRRDDGGLQKAFVDSLVTGRKEFPDGKRIITFGRVDEPHNVVFEHTRNKDGSPADSNPDGSPIYSKLVAEYNTNGDKKPEMPKIID
jgi:hypothetical protein